MPLAAVPVPVVVFRLVMPVRGLDDVDVPHVRRRRHVIHDGLWRDVHRLRVRVHVVMHMIARRFRQQAR